MKYARYQTQRPGNRKENDCITNPRGTPNLDGMNGTTKSCSSGAMSDGAVDPDSNAPRFDGFTRTLRTATIRALI